jgi:hypothetical protein
VSGLLVQVILYGLAAARRAGRGGALGFHHRQGKPSVLSAFVLTAGAAFFDIIFARSSWSRSATRSKAAVTPERLWTSSWECCLA